MKFEKLVRALEFEVLLVDGVAIVPLCLGFFSASTFSFITSSELQTSSLHSCSNSPYDTFSSPESKSSILPTFPFSFDVFGWF